MNDLQNTTIEKVIEHLGRQLEAIKYHFLSAQKDLRDLKLLLDKQKRVKTESNPHSHEQTVCQIIRKHEECCE